VSRLPDRVQLFTTCLIDAFEPAAGMAVARVLERLGLAVDVPAGQTCCGQPAYNAGAWDDARAMARHTVDVLSRSPAPVVVPSGSCAAMIAEHYPELLADDARYHTRAMELAARTFEFSRFLVDVLGATDLGARYDGSVAYHHACHQLRWLPPPDLPRYAGGAGAPLRLLAAVAGAEVRELPGATECCGFGGLFAVTQSDISGAMLARKLDAIEQSGAGTIVSCDVSCLLHIGGGLRRRGSRVRVCHLAELLGGASA
jgi:L-lactate dehydrogenase complex protein LldE